MTWIDKARQLFARKDYSVSDPAVGQFFLRYPLGRKGTDKDANTKSVWVFAGVRLIAEKIASIPFNFYSGDEIAKNNAELKRSVFRNPFFTFYEMISMMVASEELQGWSAVQIVKPFMKVLDVANLKVEADASSKQITYTYNENGKLEPLDPDTVVLFRNYSPQYKLTGMSSLSAAVAAINLDYHSMNNTEESFENGLYINGVLTSPNSMGDKEATTIGKQFKENYGKNAKGIPVLYNGFRLEKLSLTPADYDLLKYQGVTKNVICTALGVPTFLLNDMEHANYANAREQEGIFVRYTVLPKLIRRQEAINMRLLPALGIKEEFRYEVQSLPEMQEDSEKTARIRQIKVNAGSLTINEWRNLEGFEPVEGGDQPYVPMNLVPLSSLNVTMTTEPEIPPEKPEEDKLYGNLKELLKAVNPDAMTKEMKERLWKSAQVLQKPQSAKLKSEIVRILKKLEEGFIAVIDQHLEELLPLLKSLLEAELKKEYQTKKAIDEELLRNLRRLILSQVSMITIEKTIRRYLTAYAQQSGDNTVANYGWNIVFSMSDPVVREFLLKRPNLLAESIYGTHVNEAGTAIKRIFLRADEEGWTFEQIKEAIKEELGDFWGADRDWKAEQVAKTEVGAVHNSASRAAAVQAGMKFHAWFWAGSAHPREHHQAMNSDDWIPINESFNVGGVSILCPANSGIAEEDINCNCIELFSLIGGE